MYIDTEQRPKVHRLTNYVVAILLHLGLFLVFLSMGVFHLPPQETITLSALISVTEFALNLLTAVGFFTRL